MNDGLIFEPNDQNLLEHLFKNAQTAYGLVMNEQLWLGSGCGITGMEYPVIPVGDPD